MESSFIAQVVDALKEAVEDSGPKPSHFLNSLRIIALASGQGNASLAIQTAVTLTLIYAVYYSEHALAIELWLGRDGNQEASDDLAELVGQLVVACPITVTLDPP